MILSELGIFFLLMLTIERCHVVVILSDYFFSKALFNEYSLCFRIVAVLFHSSIICLIRLVSFNQKLSYRAGSECFMSGLTWPFQCNKEMHSKINSQ